MTWNRRIIGVGAAIAGAAFVAATTPAEAGGARPRAAKTKKRHHFKSAPAPVHAKTPALASNGAADTSMRTPAAGAAVQGDFRQSVVDGGAILAMSPSRALVLNSYRGLSLVDTTDPAAPRVLATVAVDGTGERMFLGTGEVAVVSDVHDAAGSRTIVTSINVADAALSVAGAAQATGALRDAARQGDDLLLVTGDANWGPIVYMTAAGGKPGGGPVAFANGARPTAASNSLVAPGGGGAMPPIWYGGSGTSHVVRVRIAAGGAPSLLGTIDVTGDVLADSITGTDAVLAVQQNSAYAYPLNTLLDPGTGAQWAPPTVSLARFSDDAAGAPKANGALDLTGVTGIAALDRSGATLRALEYTDTAELVAAFDISSGAPVAQDSLALPDWPSAWAFSGGAFVYGTTNWNWNVDPSLPKDPVFDPSGVANAFNGGAAPGKTKKGPATGFAVAGPTSTLHAVDLRDPTHLVAGGSADLGAGWLSTLVAVDAGVVGTRYAYDQDVGTTSMFRADVSSPSMPTVSASVDLGGYANLGPVLGDLLLVVGGSTDAGGSFVPSTQLVDLKGGGLVLGGSFAVASWTSSAARDGNVLGLAAYDRLTLVDVGDVANPQVKGEVRLVVNVAGFAALDVGTGAALVTDYLGGGVEIRTVPLPGADALKPLDVLKIATGDAQMFAAPPFLYVVVTDWSTGRAMLQIVDASDPSHLAARGSLDLSSYPGQVFLKGQSLMMLREATSLFADTTKGKRKAVKDAFGKCPQGWLRDGFATALDVVDLRDPDAPVAALRLRLAWDDSGEAILDGDSLYVSSYVDVTGPNDDSDQYAYTVREIDVTNPFSPRVGPAVDVPGTIVAGSGAAHRVLTTDYSYDDATGSTKSSLHLVDLSAPFQTRVLATHALDGWPDSVTVGSGRAYVTVETWGGVDANGQQTSPKSAAELVTFDLADLSISSTVSRDQGAYDGEIRGGRLFLRTWGWTGALAVYSLASPDAPVFVASKDVAGLAGDISVVEPFAYVPGGLYGVEVLDLTK